MRELDKGEVEHVSGGTIIYAIYSGTMRVLNKKNAAGGNTGGGTGGGSTGGGEIPQYPLHKI